MKKDMDSLQDRFDLMTIQNKEYSHHISRQILTERENSALRTRLQKLSSECFSMRKDFDYLLEKENAFSELAKVHDSLLDEYETLRKDNNKLASQFRENEQMLELLQQENEMLHKKCQKFEYQSQNDIQGFHNELQDVEIILKQNIEEKQKLQENIAELNEQLEIKEFEILEAQEKVKELSRKLVKHESEIQDMTELKKENEKIQKLILEQQNTMSVLKAHKAEMATEIENLKTLNARFEDIKEQNVELNSILMETREKISVLEKENMTTKEEASNFVKMYEESRSELEQCRDNLDILQKENEHLNDTCKRIDCQLQANLENKAEYDNEIRLSGNKIEVHGDQLLNTNDADQEDTASSTAKSQEISHEEFVDIFLTPTRIETQDTDCEEDVSNIDYFLLNDDKFEEELLSNGDIKEQRILDIVSNYEMKDLCHQKSKKSVHPIQGAREDKRRNSAENAFQERLENVLKANVVLAEEKFEIEAKLQESLKENEAMTFQIIMLEDKRRLAMSQNKELQQELVECRRKLMMMEIDVNNSKETDNDNESKQEIHKYKLQILSAKYEEMKEERDELQKKCSKSNISLHKVQSQRVMAEYNSKGLELTVADLSSQMNLLDEEYKELNSMYHKRTKENEELNQNVHFLDLQLRIRNENHNELWDKYTDIRKQLKELEWKHIESASLQREFTEKEGAASLSQKEMSLSEVIHGSSTF
eukprot:gene1495-15931_t